jgi:hypothetical protein
VFVAGGGVTIAANALRALSAPVSFEPKITSRLDTGSIIENSASAVSAGTPTVSAAFHTQAAIRVTTAQITCANIPSVTAGLPGSSFQPQQLEEHFNIPF